MPIDQLAQGGHQPPTPDPILIQSTANDPMRFNTHDLINADLVYFGFDLNAPASSGEYLGISIGRLYLGLYDLGKGLEFACGILNEAGALD